MVSKQKRAQAKKRPQRVRAMPRRARTAKSKAQPRLAHEILNPVFSENAWVPKCLQYTPTVRIRDRAQLNISAVNGDTHVMLLGAWESNIAHTFGTGGIIPNLLGVRGLNVTLGNAGTNIDANLTTGLPPGRARLHRLAMTITCNGPTAVGALLPTSSVRAGVIRTLIDPFNYTNFGQVSTTLQSKTEMKTFTAYQLMTKPVHVTDYPLDVRSWESLLPQVTGTSTTIAPNDSMAQIGLLIFGTSTLDNFSIVFHTEWDILPADDGSSPNLLASAAVRHPVAPPSLLDKAVDAATSVCGIFEKGATIISDVGNAATAVHSALNSLSRLPGSLPVLAGISRFPAIAL